MNNRILLAAAAVAALTTLAIADISVSANYNAGNRGGYTYENNYLDSGTQMTAHMEGVGMGGGAAYAVDTANGNMIVFVNTGGGSGQAYSGTDVENVPEDTLVHSDANVGADSAGAWGYASVTIGW